MSESIIQPYSDGPYVVRGDFTLLDEDGREIELHRASIALCRCGRSRIKPFCDGTHKLVGRRVRDASGDEANEPSSPPAG